jgi:glycosyltransferase involved in cell wall biosynthesis
MSKIVSPLVSVFMMTYNHEEFIAKAIEGVLLQITDFKIQIVIGEDCSTDKTKDIILGYHSRWPEKFKLILQEKNVGAFNNQLDVFRHCSGKFIAMCEGDDYWTDPYKLQKQVDFLEANPDFALCFHDVMINKDDELIDNYITTVPATVTTIEDISRGNYIHTCSTVFRREFVTLPSWYDSKLNAGDYPLYLILAAKGKLYYMQEKMCVYRVHSGGVYSNAKMETLMRGNIYLLKTLIRNFNNAIVRKNLRLQLRNMTRNLYALYNDKGEFGHSGLLVIANLRSFVDISWLNYYRIQIDRFLQRNVQRVLKFIRVVN